MKPRIGFWSIKLMFWTDHWNASRERLDEKLPWDVSYRRWWARRERRRLHKIRTLGDIDSKSH